MQMEVAYRFLVGFVDSAGNYCDSLAAVAVLQLSSPSLFWFNLVTSVPVAWIEWATVQVYSEFGTCPDTDHIARDCAKLIARYCRSGRRIVPLLAHFRRSILAA
jgi:hypothetical protein